MIEEKLAFCYSCAKDVTYKIIEIDIERNYKGKIYRFKGKDAICDCCGKSIGLPDIIDYNVHAFAKEYKLENNIKSK